MRPHRVEWWVPTPPPPPTPAPTLPSISGFLQRAVERLRHTQTTTPAPTPVKHWFAHSMYGGKERVYFGLYNYQEIRHHRAAVLGSGWDTNIQTWKLTDAPRTAAPRDVVLRQNNLPEADGMSKRDAAGVINKLFLQRTRSVSFHVAPPSGTAASKNLLAKTALAKDKKLLAKDKNLFEQMETRWGNAHKAASLPALATAPAPAPS